MYPQTKPKRQRTSAAPAAAAGQAAAGGGAKRSAGGGGGGCPKPRRSDPVRQMMRQPVPGQAEALALANEYYYSPHRRLAACRHQRASGTHHPVCPLSPVEAHPCATPDCNCKLSHQQLVLSVPLHSPSQVPRAAPRPPPPRACLLPLLARPRPAPAPHPHPRPTAHPTTLPTPLPVQSRAAHYLAGPVGRATRAKIEAERGAAKEARVATKVAAAAAREEQAESVAASALASFAPRGQGQRAQSEAAEEAGAPSGPRGGHWSSPRRPRSTGAPSSPSPRSGVANLLLAFGDVSPDG